MKIAITGGIGSGKSTVSQIIKKYGYNVYSCDEIYNLILQEKEFVTILENNFGKKIIKDNELDRKALSKLVFNDSVALSRLNKLTHPKIIEKVLNLMSKHEVSFCEVPLLFENGYENYFDKVIVILREINSRINAVKERDCIDNQDVINRINSQLDYDNYNFEEYYVIHNNGNFNDLETQTVKLLRKINLKIN